MANSLHKMATFYAADSNWFKTLVYCKEALTYVDLPNIRSIKDDTLQQIEKMKKFETILSKTQWIITIIIGGIIIILYIDTNMYKYIIPSSHPIALINYAQIIRICIFIFKRNYYLIQRQSSSCY